MLSGATAFAIAQPNQPADTAKAGGSKQVVKQLKQVNANLQTINSSVVAVDSGVDTLNDRIGSSSVNDVQALLGDINRGIGTSRFSSGTVRGLLDDIEFNTSP
jgi:uncharacterized phage infection (PIP) family protein YhgE